MRDFDTFVADLHALLDDTERATDHRQRLVEDLGYDSFHLIQAVFWAEEGSQATFPEEVVTSLQTIGDLFAVYQSHAHP